jgi:hypothetical protein
MRPCAIAAGATLLSACLLTTSLDGLTGAVVTGGDSGTPISDAPSDVGTEADVSLDGAMDAAIDAADAALASRYAAAVLADQPIAYLRLGDSPPPDGGTPTLTDLVAPGRLTIVRGSPRFGDVGALAGDPDHALGFSGSDFVQFGQAFGFPGTAPFTLEFWAKPANSTGFEHLFTKQDRGPTPVKEGYAVWWTNGSFGFERFEDGGIRATSGPASAPSGYTYIVATYDGATMRLYLDGQLTSPGTNDPRSLSDPIAPPILAAASTVGEAAFVGSIDELAIYDKVLLDTRIVAHFEAAR